jgi:hypothetical protein
LWTKSWSLSLSGGSGGKAFTQDDDAREGFAIDRRDLANLSSRKTWQRKRQLCPLASHAAEPHSFHTARFSNRKPGMWFAVI